ncbi:hypothetical protein ACFYKX_11705 [Cytobacillus sp. FJAT-54145]|uniref:Uncharacterized protein n=1 Tax=Cytobacillus spartinae TaxID=3299023 RepID=A0ABW6KDZ9_9BACI
MKKRSIFSILSVGVLAACIGFGTFAPNEAEASPPPWPTFSSTNSEIVE